MATIEQNLSAVEARIAAGAAAAGRRADAVALLVVSKTHAADAVRAAFAAGARRFGENYVQEAVDKIAALADLRPALEWHLIGPLQSNKTRTVAEQFDWVQSVDRLKIAERLSEQRPDDLPPLQVCLQVNIDGGPTKSGLAAEAVGPIAHAVAVLPRLRLRGLMAIPELAAGDERRRAPHRALRLLFERLRAEGLALDTLSIGMSEDFDAAIAEGATIVRVGRAIFGARQSPATGPAALPCRATRPA